MSRYVAWDDGERLVVFGWDPPLGTFFAQEYDRTIPEDSDEDDLLWWLGYVPREIGTVERLVEVAAERGHSIPDAICQNLAADADQPWEPGPLQAKLGFLGKET